MVKPEKVRDVLAVHPVGGIGALADVPSLYLSFDGGASWVDQGYTSFVARGERGGGHRAGSADSSRSRHRRSRHAREHPGDA